MPGVQNPHCRPCLFQKASCSGCRSTPFDSPSMVVTDDPETCTVSAVHDFAMTPSSFTVQVPHWLVSHPTFVPVSPAFSRMKCDQ